MLARGIISFKKKNGKTIQGKGEMKARCTLPLANGQGQLQQRKNSAHTKTDAKKKEDRQKTLLGIGLGKKKIMIPASFTCFVASPQARTCKFDLFCLHLIITIICGRSSSHGVEA